MRQGRCGDRSCFSDDKLHPKPFFANWLRPYVLDAGLGAESVSLAQLRLVLADERRVETSPLEHRQAIFLSTLRQSPPGKNPLLVAQAPKLLPIPATQGRGLALNQS